jgi:hypothetical protein
MINWVIFEQKGILKIWKIPMLINLLLEQIFQILGNIWAKEYHIYQGEIYFFYNRALEDSFRENLEKKDTFNLV